MNSRMSKLSLPQVQELGVFSVCVCVCVCVTQSCPTLCNPMDYSLPGSSVHGILQARILECVAMPSSRGSPQARARTWISCIAGRFFTTELPGKPQEFSASTKAILHTQKNLWRSWFCKTQKGRKWINESYIGRSRNPTAYKGDPYYGMG